MATTRLWLDNTARQAIVCVRQVRPTAVAATGGHRPGVVFHCVRSCYGRLAAVGSECSTTGRCYSMFRIRRIYDARTSPNRERLAQVQAILRAQFPGIKEAQIRKLPDQLVNPLKYRFRSVLLVAEDARLAVRGFALLAHAPDLEFCLLDFISTSRDETGRGVGGALYERVREDAAALGVVGLFFECLPDDPALSPDPKVRAQNAARLRFYEHYGARPIANTRYETPLSPNDTDPPYLVFDAIGNEQPLRRTLATRIVRAILERKYGQQCSPSYVDGVVRSFKDDPVTLRAPRYTRPEAKIPTVRRPHDRKIALVVSDAHQVHHVRERGYVQSPVRMRSILSAIEPTELFEHVPIESFPLKHIEAVHDREFVHFLRNASAGVPDGKSVYPYVFPLRNPNRRPKDLPLQAGYYCIDTFTPINANAYKAAVRAVECALTAAHELLDGARLAYALVRPPGHHAERRAFGGFCYFNSAAIAAHSLSEHGRVVVLDIDYHHGNGTQDIFFERNDVLTVSIHGHPSFSYPYFSGYEDERGSGQGLGFNLNIPLPEGIAGEADRRALRRALEHIEKFAPVFLVVSLGLDVVRGDPTGAWLLGARDLQKNGQLIGALGVPTLVVQEGGYRTRTLGTNARHFFQGLLRGSQEARQKKGRRETARPRRSE
jgi:acetoin utilization deacetylase AcuC-like enzyme/GNAT superfamily N-acetyltransferase